MENTENMETVVHCNVEKNARLIAQILDFDAEGMEYDWYEQHIDLLAKNLEPKRGEWVGVEYDGYADGNPVYDLWECSVCGEEHNGEADTLPNFCPNCGAKMEVQDDA